MIDEFIPFHRPSVGQAERAAVDAVLAGGWLTTGERTRSFEVAFASFVGARHAVAVNSATAALHLAFEGLGVSDGDEVVVPTYTFTASAETVLYCRARPVLVDIDESTLNVDPEAVRRAISPRTAAVEVVHFGGLPASMVEIQAAVAEASKAAGLAGPAPIVEDVAHAFPSRISSLGGRLAGTIGRAGAFSFYATKTITTGEGGMLVTEDDSLAERARMMRLHGISHDAWKRYTAAGTWYYEVEEAGFKDNPTDIASALGLAQLPRADELRLARRDIAEQYLHGLDDLSRSGRLVLPVVGEADEHAWHLFVVRLTEGDQVNLDLPGVAGLPAELHGVASSRARAIDRLRELGVGTSVHFIPLHLHPLYRRMGYVSGDFPRAERAYAGAISLPIWPGMTESHVDSVIGAVRSAI